MMLTRLPSGRRASTIGEDSSTRPDLGDDLVDDSAHVRVVVEADVRLVETSLPLDPDVERPVHHDLGHAFVRKQPFERPVAERVVGDLGGEPLAVVAREALLLRKVAPRVVENLFAQSRGIESGVEQARAEYADHGEVNPVLELCERIVATREPTADAPLSDARVDPPSVASW